MAEDQRRTMVGPANRNWRGGEVPYYGPTWQRAKRETRKRDAVCQECGIDPLTLGRALDVHHRIPFRAYGIERHAEANVLTNLIALCNRCHLQVEWDTNRRYPVPVV
jgi:5-methylcytosine-specific restriction endonuclease McrA